MEVSTTERQTWTILSLLEWGTGYLAGRGIESSRYECDQMLCRVLECRRIDLYLRFDSVLTADQLSRFKALFTRRLAREPLQYILGDTEFMGLPLSVDRRALIPRPETELLVAEVIALAREPEARVHRVLDVGTGSGNIAVSLAHHLPGCSVDAIDVSSEALELAAENIGRHRLEDRVRLMRLDLLAEGDRLEQGVYDVIVANPPYVSAKEYALLEPEVKEFEPALATTDGGDGLTFFKAIAPLGLRALRSGGSVMVEHAYDQSGAVSALFTGAGYVGLQTVRDYNGILRIVKARVS
jgi:release factor glutamine methyltransferase